MGNSVPESGQGQGTDTSQSGDEPTDSRTYIKLHDGMPDHPKVAGLSDAAFRVIVSAWCYCSRHLTDGLIPKAVLRRYGPPRASGELVKAGLLVDRGPDGWECHDYLKHQRSAAKVRSVREINRRNGSKGGQSKAGRGASEPLGDSPSGSLGESPSESLAESESTSVSTPRGSSRVMSPKVTREDVDLDRVRKELTQHRGGPLDEGWAGKVIEDILGRSAPRENPTGYVLRCIRNEPERYLPTSPVGTLRLVSGRPTWCGECASPGRRVVEVDDQMKPCPRCSPERRTA